jgi:hypothetical protein
MSASMPVLHLRVHVLYSPLHHPEQTARKSHDH